MPKLSELGQQKVTVISEPVETEKPAAGTTMKLSDVRPDAVVVVSEPKKTVQETELDQIRTRASSWLAPVVAAGRQFDRFTGAPIRAAIGAVQDSKNPATALFDQFSKQPEEAPTGKEIAEKAGISTDNTWSIPGLKIPRVDKSKSGGMAFDDYKFSPAGAVGLGVDIAADWTNVVPISAVAKGAAKVTGATVKPMAVMGIHAGAKGADLLTGTKVGTGALKYTAEKAKAVKLAFSDLFNPKQAADFPEMMRIAQKNGINDSLLPEAIEFGHNSVVTRSARVRAESPLGQGQLEKFTEGLQQTKNATSGVIKNIAGGTVLNKVEAGAVIRQGYDNAVARLFNGMDDTYTKIAAKNPGLRLTDEAAGKLYNTLDDLQAFAQGRLARGVTSQQKSQASQLLQAIEAVKSTGKSTLIGAGPLAPPSLQGVVEVMRNTGEAAFKKQAGMALDPPDVQRLRALYGDLREAVIGTIEKSVPDGQNIVVKLRENNRAISEFMDDSSVLSRTIKGDISDETIFSRLVEQGDTKKAEALSKILTPQELQEVKGAFLESMLARNATEDDFTFKGTINRMKSKQAVLEQLLTPEEIKEFTDILRLGDRFGQPVMSTSGTGASNVFKNITQGVNFSVINDSFINTLKQRARGHAGGEPIKAMDFSGVLEMKRPYETLPGQSFAPGNNYFSNTRQTLLENLRPSGTEVRLKGARVLSTQEIDANDGRKEAIRRKILTRGNN